MTDAQLAHAIGCRKSSVNAWRTNRQLPRIDMAMRICKETGISLDELAGFTPLIAKGMIPRFREILSAITKQGEYDSLTLHQWAAEFDRASQGRMKLFTTWLRNLAESLYKLEVTCQVVEQPKDFLQLSLFENKNLTFPDL